VALSIIANKRDWFAVKEWADFPVFSDSDDAIKALARSLESFESRSSRVRGEKKALLAEKGLMAPPLGASEIVPPADVFALLEKYGLFVAEFELAEGTEGAIAAAARIGYPVALKNGSPHMIHKTEKKGVVLNIANPEALRSAARELAAADYLVQKMYPSAVEVIIGVKHDREFGHALLFGLGGTYVELFRDTAVRVLPVDEDSAGEMMEEVKGSAILKGYRGSRPLDIKALKETLVKISRLVLENPELETIDLNPVIVLEEGRGTIVLDAKMESRRRA
jgi:acyl-CoA synthetase (NDP forming)